MLLVQHVVQMSTTYQAECRDRHGVLKWVGTAHNLVVTAGLDKLLDACFKTGLTAPAGYVGLKSTGTPDAADVMTSHATWTELVVIEGARPAFTPGTIAAGSVSNTASKAVFTANNPMSVAGLFLADDGVKSATAGTLYGAAAFTEGTRAMVSGDVLSVTATLTATAT